MVDTRDGDAYRKHLREQLAKITDTKVVPLEPIEESGDDKAVDEAKAIAEGQYEQIERQRRKAKIRSIIEENKDKTANRRLRWRYAKRVFCYLVCYSIFVGVLLILSGFEIFGFKLPESVLGFLVGSTAASAIGLVFAVTNGLFGNLNSKSK